MSEVKANEEVKVSTEVEEEIVTEVKEEKAVEVKEEKQVEINVSEEVFMKLSIQEYDKKIAEAEAYVYELKKLKAAFVYDKNLDRIVKKSEEMKAQPKE